jgi:DNA-binding MarR family transcriptional regulator
MPVDLASTQALLLWRNIAFALIHDGRPGNKIPDFTTRQLVILLIVYIESPPHTVRGLAAKLGVTKPVVTRALDTLGKYQLLARRRDENDRRNVVVQRTVKGALYVERLGDIVVAKAADLPD